MKTRKGLIRGRKKERRRIKRERGGKGKERRKGKRKERGEKLTECGEKRIR